MSCRERDDAILDVARGIAPAEEEAALLRHVEECAACRQRLQRERALTAGLRALDEATPGDAASPEVEAALLAAFSARQAPSPAAGLEGASSRRVWMAAAAAVILCALGAVVAWRGGLTGDLEGPPVLAGRPLPGDPRFEVLQPPVQPAVQWAAASPASGAGREGRGAAAIRGAMPRPSGGDSSPGAFVPWPGAAALPAFENGELVRTELPASVLPLLGIAGATPAADATVAVDVVVGQDGFARAVRLARR
jgi:hypothetical protein